MGARVITLIVAIIATGLASPVLSQLGPQLGSPLGVPAVGQTVGDVAGSIGRTVDRATNGDLVEPVRSVAALARDRVRRLADFARRNRAQIDLDEDRQPARRGIVMLLDPDAGSLDTARRLGFTARDVAGLEGLGLAASELSIPEGMALTEALKRLRTALPDKTVTADQIHFQSGSVAPGASRSVSKGEAPISTPVGMIDGGVAPMVPVIRAQTFSAGGPTPSDHGTAIASLLRNAGVAKIISADVYGRDPAGGSALAIARALGWMASENVPVVSISLVGPRNPLLERAIAGMTTRGTIIVAAVGNDGPAAAPAYPASYPSVLAVTGVDAKQRPLIEAGRALHLDYAAPAADMKALDLRGRDKPVRGTSFAAPFVAVRAAAAIDSRKPVRAALDAEAQDLGPKGADAGYGRGLLCGLCARR
jgi:hypothetical protein